MRTALRWMLLAGLSIPLTSCGGGGSAAPALTGIAVSPHSILSWPDQVFTAKGVYSDGSTGALNAQVTWTDNVDWVRMDAMGASQADAVCLAPAPLIGMILPQPAPATITATATVNGQTFTASATLYCH